MTERTSESALSNDYSKLSEQARSFLQGEKQLFINGRWRSARRGSTLPVVDPTNGREVARIADAAEEDVDAAVEAARHAFESGPWPKMRPHEREQLMLRLADLIAAEIQPLAEIECVNSGKLIGNTRLFDAELSVHTLRYMAGWATKLHGQTMDLSVPYLPDQRFSGFTRRTPVGVVAGITPWNVPLCQAVWKLAPVLATGCTLVLKPAEQTSLTAIRLAKLCSRVGIPEGVVNVITGRGSVAGVALASHPGVDKISFTGSTNVGRHIAETAAKQLKRVSLELGGKSPVVIAPDADLDIAIPGAAWAIFGNNGQNCCAGSRLYVHTSIFDRVIEGVVKIADEMQLGPGLDPTSMMGPMVSVAHRSRVVQFVSSAVSAGASLLAGGDILPGPGAYLRPTILMGTPSDHDSVQQEIFGPVLNVFRFNDDAEAIRLSNDTRFGLGASIWTSRIATATRYLEAFRAGTVWINTHNILDLSLPFGGLRDSGIGQELGQEGVLSYTQLRAVVMRQ
ncbi:aldehyde dehydrogenase family protein [Bradyrhizobium liaoningense]|uniref:aldehyde dehydrogenase family protein n=1 Tax=Bradyrhizobium liaoningense TaxID=43992 RepID=UPI001BADE9C7|nr:aldehyde dehydrogenase family protein [Bradyrhizobium liaoningense]MBR0988036.1 aldehyde dehydrogenase family protein [Bradyrhizobium liaoningense]